MSDTLDLACELIRRRSVTPDDAGCQAFIGDRLARLGFRLEPMPFGEVTNLWARRGNASPLFCFAGHTDVVPPGPIEDWSHDPFIPIVRDGRLFGRGAVDMKGGLAAMLTACERFLAENPEPRGSIAFLLTSDEEGVGLDGTRRVVETLEARGEKIDYCVVGEATSEGAVGDLVRNGRRGSLTARLSILGKQGHVAYPHLADNPIHKAAPFVAELAAAQWDQGNDFFPPTSLQIVEINAGTGTNNVIPGDMSLMFNFRFSTETTPERLQDQVKDLLEKHGLAYRIEWSLSGMPFLTEKGSLTEATERAIRDVSGIGTRLSTGGGTSDGRFIAPTGAQVIEVGPSTATVHKVDENVRVEELDAVSRIYEKILQALLIPG